MVPRSGVMWPRYLSRQQAAFYVGVSVDTFNAEVRAGMWPAGRPRGGRGGKMTWDRKLLDFEADRFAGLLQPIQDVPNSSPPDPAGEALERMIREQTQKLRAGKPS